MRDGERGGEGSVWNGADVLGEPWQGGSWKASLLKGCQIIEQNM